jgi:hypothetical protein
MRTTTTPAIAVVPRTADTWTVEGLRGQTFPDQIMATLAAGQRVAKVRSSVWIRFQGERVRLLRY